MSQCRLNASKPVPEASFLALGPEFWRGKVGIGKGGIVRWGAAFAAALLLGGLAFFALRWLDRRPPATEIAVFFPGTNDRNWLDFVAGVRLAAEEAGRRFSQAEQECRVELDSGAVLFRWYPEVGSRGIARAVASICQRPNPPVALVGANNSGLTWALARELSRCDRSHAPLLLMTNATADALIEVLPGRSFRFGHNNSAQAAAVVALLAAEITDGKSTSPEVAAAIVQVADDPFSVDLASCFAAQLQLQLDAQLVADPRAAGSSDRSAAPAWTLATSTGDFDNPSPEERALAQRLVEQMAAQPDRVWALVLPVGTAQYRRLAYALQRAMNEFADPAAIAALRRGLVILSGDSLDYYNFRQWRLNQLLPEESPARVIFFAHANPVDASVAPPPDPTIPAKGLNREVARALLATLSAAGPQPTPERLAQRLAEYVPRDSVGPMFRDGERGRGGGAVLVRLQKSDFEILLPEAWRK